jgi:hypothetical protein
MTDCGSCLAAAGKSKYPSPDIVQSCKNWQTSFFYVKSPDQGPDLLNLPEFSLARPVEKHQWALKHGAGDCDVDAQATRVTQLEREGLLATDLVAAWLHARILPLQRRVHRLCDVSGPRDPTRLCTWEVKTEVLCARVKAITASALPDPFRFGLDYLTRQRKPPVVCSDYSFFRLHALPIALITRAFFSALHSVRPHGGRPGSWCVRP